MAPARARASGAAPSRVAASTPGHQASGGGGQNAKRHCGRALIAAAAENAKLLLCGSAAPAAAPRLMSSPMCMYKKAGSAAVLVLVALLLVSSGVDAVPQMSSIGAGLWKERVAMGYTCSGAEYRGTVPNANKTAAGCLAAAQALNRDAENCRGGVNYAISPVSSPEACYVCRAPGVSLKLRKNPDQISFVLEPLPPAPPPCPPPPPPAPIPHYHCVGSQCVAGRAHVSYTDPSCFGYCNASATLSTEQPVQLPL